MDPYSRRTFPVARILAAGVAALAIWTACAGCGEEFDPSWRVQEYRLLAIQADPVTLEPGGQTTLRVLDWAPQGVEVSYQWEWCPLRTPPQSSYRCPFDNLQQAVREADRTGDGGMGGAMFDPSIFQLGGGQSVQLSYPGSREQILGACQSLQQALAEAGGESPLASLLPSEDCERGYDISVRLKVKTDGSDEIVARKELTLWTGSEQKNGNPRQVGMQIRVNKPEDIPKVRERLDWVPEQGTTSQEQWVDIPADEPLPVLTGIPFETRLLVEPDSVETWRPPVPKGSDREQSAPERETLVFDWLTTKGNIFDSQSIFREDLNDLTAAGSSGWVMHESPEECRTTDAQPGDGELFGEACDVYLWAIVRDGRLGLDWAERRLKIVGDVGGSEAK